MVTATVAAATIALAATAAPSAHAAHVDNVAGVGSCSATYFQDGVHRTCTFVATPGYYRLEISSQASYAWAKVSCQVLGPDPAYPAMVSVVGPGYASRTVALGGGVCTLEVAATGGQATGTVS